MHDAQIRVLIVDDSATIRENLSRMLTELENVEVVGQAQDASGGLELTRQLHPDLVTLDIRMQRGSGLDLIPRLKELEPPPIVVVLTNYPYHAYRRRAAEAGSDFFFDKSTEFHKMLVALRNGIQAARPSDPTRSSRRTGAATLEPPSATDVPHA